MPVGPAVTGPFAITPRRPARFLRRARRILERERHGGARDARRARSWAATAWAGGSARAASARSTRRSTRRLDRWVAVKVIPADGETPVRARREAVAAARLEHPGIVAIYDAGEEDGARYLVCELVEGRTLAQLEQAGELTDRDVLRVGLALCDALAARPRARRRAPRRQAAERARPRSAAHAGAARPSWPTSASRCSPATTRSRARATWSGRSPTWRPEQAAGKRVDDRADLYALALVLYEALGGRQPRARRHARRRPRSRVGKPVAEPGQAPPRPAARSWSRAIDTRAARRARPSAARSTTSPTRSSRR